MNSIDYKALDSQIIRLLRFPLALMVVFLHAEPNVVGIDVSELYIENLWANIAGLIMYGISHVLTQVAVPTFFLISGYLFFLSFDGDRATWKRKLKSRFFSIVIPYVLWVLIFIAVHLGRHMHGISSLPAWISDNGGLAALFWNSQQWVAGADNIFGQKLLMTGPFAFHLWFLRDLIVALVLTPAFYLLFWQKDDNRIRILSVVCLSALLVLNLLRIQTNIPGFSFSTMFYFGLGAFISLNHLYLSKIFYSKKEIIWMLTGVVAITAIFLDGSRTPIGSLIFPVCVLFMVVSLLNFAVWYYGKNFGKKLSLGLESSSFFLFVIHPFFLGVIWAALSALSIRIFHVADIMSVDFVNAHPLYTLILFFSKVLIAALISILTYKIINKTSPRISKFLCGR